jgi:chaperonin cofactor prefoldin
MYKGKDAKLKFSELKKLMDDAFNAAVEEAVEEAEAKGEEWDGVLNEGWAKFIDDIDDAVASKKTGMIRYVKEAENDIAFLKQEKKNLDKRIKTIENKVAGYSSYLDHLQGGDKFECSAGVIEYRKSKKTVYSESLEACLKEGVVPKGYEDYCDVTQVVKLPKAKINKAIKAGAELPDVQILSSVTMKIK